MEMLFIFGIIIIVGLCIAIYNYFRDLIRKFYAKRIIKRYNEFDNLVISYLINSMPKELELSTRKKENALFSIDFLIELKRPQLKHLLTINESFFKIWSYKVDEVLKLNREYPLAIPPISFGELVIRRDYYHDWDQEPRKFSEIEIKQLPLPKIETILATEISKFSQSQQINSFLADLDYTIDICSLNAPAIIKSNKNRKDLSAKEAKKLRANPFERFSVPFKEDVYNFAFRLRMGGHYCFYHFTDRSNLKSIIDNGGLYSWKALDELGISSKTGGDSLSHQLDVRKGLQDYVRLGIASDHPMMYRLEQLGYDLVILYIHPIVAMFKDTLFSNVNATDNDCLIGGELRNLMSLSRYAGSKSYVSRDDKCFKAKQGEVLIPHFIPLKYIINIYDLVSNPKSII